MSQQIKNILLRFNPHNGMGIVQTPSGRKCRVEFFGEEPQIGDILLGDFESTIIATTFNKTQDVEMYICVDDID